MSHTVGAATANYVREVNRRVPEILQDGTVGVDRALGVSLTGLHAALSGTCYWLF